MGLKFSKKKRFLKVLLTASLPYIFIGSSGKNATKLDLTKTYLKKKMATCIFTYTLFISITIFCGSDNIPQSIPEHSPH